MKIGIPRGLLYYKYKDLWVTFFKELDCDVIISPNTNKKIVNDGIKCTVDEACLSFKIYMGHIKYLKDKCDYILIPRIGSLSKYDKVCVRFNGIYDVVKNTFSNINIINYNIDYDFKKKESKEIIKMGINLGFKKKDVRLAYKKAYLVFSSNKFKKIIKEEEKLNKNNLKILIVSHPYNINDDFIGKPIIKYLNNNNIEVIDANNINEIEATKIALKFSEDLYWKDSKQLIGGLLKYKDDTDGIIFLSTFPCGLDSLVNELALRKIKKIPKLNIIIDELESEVGLKTRLESFIDIIKEYKHD